MMTFADTLTEYGLLVDERKHHVRLRENYKIALPATIQRVQELDVRLGVLVVKINEYDKEFFKKKKGEN